jgi:predicted RNA-binding protein with PUA-like domain
MAATDAKSASSSVSHPASNSRMNHWVFKATPPAKDGSGYDYIRELRVGREENWDLVTATEPMRVGDRVFFWASSPLHHVAGLVR